MTRFNTKNTKAKVTSPVKATGKVVANHNGGKGYLRDEKSELVLLAVVNFVGQNTFYESGGSRDDRYTQLIHKVALSDPKWVVDMLTWLRGPGNMRTAAIVGAAEFVKARLDDPSNKTVVEAPGLNRKVINAVLQRPDEPGELLAYWTSTHGRNVPMPVKRGVADAATRMYNQRSLLKYDTASKGFRFGDVLELTHPKPGYPTQGDLFKYAIDRRHNRDNGIPDSQVTLRNNANLRAIGTDEDWVNAQVLSGSGMTWEDVLSAKGNTIDKKALWEAAIPSMGYMALLRNLRNFDEAYVSDEVAEQVARKLADPEEVAKSRQFPYRFYSAYRNAPSLRWSAALEKAIGYSTQNIPEFKGKTLILVDTSASMTGSNYSENSDVTYVDLAALFGVTLALRGGDTDLQFFATGVAEHKVRKGGSILSEVTRFERQIGKVGHGTNIAGSLQATYNKSHDRVVILTDMQTFGGWGADVSSVIPKSVPIYAFNLAGYRTSAIPSGTNNRHEFSGINDAAFRTIPLLEAGRNASWPWEK
jgi:hypothetical protein